MPRRPRILLDGGYYHILTRGNDRRKLFRYKQDYLFFLKTAKKYLVKFPLHILNYCLMPNHIHMLIEVKLSKDLPKFMQALLQVYASYFRNKYRSAGFVFQNRYKSIFIKDDVYLLECARYIERNPLRAKITDNVLDYPWGSLPFYIKGAAANIVTKLNPLYLELAATEEERRRIYQDFILKERPYEHIVDEAFKIQ